LKEVEAGTRIYLFRCFFPLGHFRRAVCRSEAKSGRRSASWSGETFAGPLTHFGAIHGIPECATTRMNWRRKVSPAEFRPDTAPVDLVDRSHRWQYAMGARYCCDNAKIAHSPMMVNAATRYFLKLCA